MKINFILPFTALTGGIRVIFLYANYLIEQGHDVVCYVPMKAYKFNNNIFQVIKASIGNTFKRGTSVEWFDCKFKVKLVPIICNKYIRNANITIATAWPTAIDVYKLNKYKGKKIYFIQDYEIWSGRTTDVDKSYMLDLNRLVISKKLNCILKNKFSVDSNIIYNGLDSDEFILGEKIINTKKTILMLYNEAPNKGTNEGISVLKRIYKKYDTRIILFGAKVSKSIPKEFEFYENPSRTLLMNLYRESDIYVFPSKNESWGLPVMEAMANKCAVVGNKVGCLEELGIDNENALIVEELNYDLMLSKIQWLINNESELKRIQNNGYMLAKKFQWSKSFKLFEEYLVNITK